MTMQFCCFCCGTNLDTEDRVHELKISGNVYCDRCRLCAIAFAIENRGDNL